MSIVSALCLAFFYFNAVRERQRSMPPAVKILVQHGMIMNTWWWREIIPGMRRKNSVKSRVDTLQ